MPLVVGVIAFLMAEFVDTYILFSLFGFLLDMTGDDNYLNDIDSFYSRTSSVEGHNTH